MRSTAEDAFQPSLLGGFVARERDSKAGSGLELAAELPIAVVSIDSPLPHLDRLFDYSIPRDLADLAVPGARVRVKFSGQDLNGFIVKRRAESESQKLVPLARVYSPIPVLSPPVYELAHRIAERYSGVVADVLRVAIPPRVASVEAAHMTSTASKHLVEPASNIAEPAPMPNPGLFSGYDGAEEFLRHLAAGGSPKAVSNHLRGFGVTSWSNQLAQVALAALASGRGTIIVVPHLRDLELLEAAFSESMPRDSFVKLTSDDGPTVRYENYLKVLSGKVQIVIGTRSAAYAPVSNLGVVCCWDDGDELHYERRAPYQHSRDVLLLRSELENTAVLMAAHGRSLESQRLLATGWAQEIAPVRVEARKVTARIISTADTFELERDPTAQFARLPQRAWQVAKKGLEHGPVLVQVARSGHVPALACQNCRELARCSVCTGPLMQSRSAGSAQLQVSCRWCGTVENNFSCQNCGGHTLRALVVGASRTAEELGRAFPHVPVISSSGENTKKTVPDKPAIVVATVGAEPTAAGGYAAALLLDGDSMLRRESLRSGEDTLRRWFNASALVRAAKDGGTVVVTANDVEEVRALVRWDPRGYAEREFVQRVELGLPPAVRLAAVTGQEHDVAAFTAALELNDEQLKDSVRVIGPAPLPSAPGSTEHSVDYRSILLFPYGKAAKVTHRMRALKASNAAKRVGQAVQIRCDGNNII